MIIKCLRSSTELRLSEDEGLRKSDGSESYLVTIKGENLDASLKVYAFDPMNKGLDRFLNKIAEQWRGWKNEEKWRSLEGEFALVCKHDGVGHIDIEATLYSPGSWTVRNTFHVVAGELDQIASDAKRFFDFGKTPFIT